MIKKYIKKQIAHRSIPILLILTMAALLQSCYYDNIEELYPQAPACDTTNVTYSNDIWPVISDNCTSCHSGGSPSANVSLSNYNEIAAAAQNGSLLGTIRHENGWSPMPKNGGKLPDCDIKKMETWVNAGTPNN